MFFITCITLSLFVIEKTIGETILFKVKVEYITLKRDKTNVIDIKFILDVNHNRSVADKQRIRYQRSYLQHYLEFQPNIFIVWSTNICQTTN